MKLLVTGGAGFIGSAFVRYVLAHRPDAHVVTLDALTYAGNLENLVSVQENPRHEFVRGDIRDEKTVNDTFDGRRLRRRGAFRRRIARRSQHPVARLRHRHQRARHVRACSMRRAPPASRASSTSRPTRSTATSTSRTRPTRRIR